MLVGCVSTPAKRYDDLAKNLGLSRSEITTDKFTLAVFHNAKPQGQKFHVYLEGDGTPFHRRVHINPEPTSTHAVALRLMSQDPNKAVLIGRPCYHQVEKNTRCDDSKWWTSHRYSEEVVDALAKAIRSLNTSNLNLRLIGFSGGGSLAVLLAAKQKEQEQYSANQLPITEVLTISANIDTKAWANHNQFTPLFGSENPIRKIPLSSPISSFHFVGERDSQLGYANWSEKLNQPPNSVFKVYPEFGHRCCWADAWPQILDSLKPH